MTQDKRSALRALIVDDEELARQYLRELLAAHPHVTVVGECKDGFQAVKAVQELDPDVVFLDIQMPKLDGFEVLELLEPARGPTPAVVFVTAYDEHALRAFEVHAVDYLLKPFTPERLADALERVQPPPPADEPPPPAGEPPYSGEPPPPSGEPPPPAGQANAPCSAGQKAIPRELAAAARPPDEPVTRVVVKDGTKIVVIPVDDLDYAEAQDDYIALHSRGQSWLKHQSIASLERTLDPERFLRIHRSVLVNLDRIVRLEPHGRDSRRATLRDGTELPVSRAGYQRLRALLTL